MDRTLGERLRAHREQHQISLAAVAAETKIKLVMLEGLENDDVSPWPEGLYRRAFVRAYARVVGLDPEVLVREFLEAHPDPVIVRPPEETEMEDPAWPAEFRRFLNSARAAMPTRRGNDSPVSENPHPAAPTHPRQADHAQTPHVIAAAPERTRPRQSPEPNLVQAAAICARLSGALQANAMAAVIEDAVTAIGAVGLVVWSWSSCKAGLTPWIAHHYSEAVLATMACIPPDADNAIAAAFRSTEPLVIVRGQNPTGAVIVPIISRGECLGVLALELAGGNEESDSVRAFAAILAAHFVQHLWPSPIAAAVSA